MNKTEQRRIMKVRRKLAEKALELIDALDEEVIAAAPLNQRASALGTVIDRMLKLHHSDLLHESSEGVTRIEYIYPDGSAHNAPHWTTRHPEDSDEVFGGGMWPPLWQDNDGEAAAD